MIVELFRQMRDSRKQNAISAETVAEVIACIKNDKSYNGDTQQDAAEFLSVLIDELEEEEQRFSQVNTVNSTDVHRLFRGEIREVVSLCEVPEAVIRLTDRYQIRCSGCGITSEKYQDIRSLSVNLPSNQSFYEQSSLGSLIDKSFDQEDISGHKCDNCGELNMTSKTTQLTDLPPYLVVALNRSQMFKDQKGECFLAKNQTRVSITSEELDLANFCDPLWAPSDTTYSLRGFVRHIGDSSLVL